MNGIKRMNRGLLLVVLLLHCMQILSGPDAKVGEPNCVLVICDFLLSTFIPVLCTYMWFLLWLWLYVILDTQYTLPRKHHFSACTLCILPAACLLHSLCVAHTDWTFPVATSLANLSHNTKTDLRVKWLLEKFGQCVWCGAGAASKRCPPHTFPWSCYITFHYIRYITSTPPHASCLPTVTHLLSQVKTPSRAISIVKQDENQQETWQILRLYMTNTQLGSPTFSSGSLTVAYST